MSPVPVLRDARHDTRRQAVVGREGLQTRFFKRPMPPVPKPIHTLPSRATEQRPHAGIGQALEPQLPARDEPDAVEADQSFVRPDPDVAGLILGDGPHLTAG